ncbi:DUF4038 domain-containing protein [Bacteroidota bacterium]
MKRIILSALAVFFCYSLFSIRSDHYTWQKIEITLTSQNAYTNPYTDVEVWVQLEGPGFSKRCYGFWDGENTWRIRIMANRSGEWSWTSGSNQADEGLNGKQGSFVVQDWTLGQKSENPLRKGMIRVSENGHALEYADETPFFWLADTWWPCMTRRYYWYDDDTRRKVGEPEAGFKDYVLFRKSQGYNGCMVIAAFPNWTEQKSDWGGGEWEDEDGNRAFFGEGNTPDLDRINPSYFQNMDRKVDYLNEHGFIPFIETSRRDIAEYWKTNFDWPESYARYIRYLYFRYQGNIVINSPIHLDAMALTGREWNEVANMVIDDYDWPFFDHLSSANPPGSTYRTFGHTDQARWLSFHSIGNERNHNMFPLLTEEFYLDDPVPCLNNEPYYDGLKWGNDADQGSDLAAYYSRVALYGSVLSGGIAGHVYGADHIWDGDIQMPGAFLIQSAEQMQYIYNFLFSEGKVYQYLLPEKELLVPNQYPNKDKNMGWGYCMHTKKNDLFLLYFEKNFTRAQLKTGLSKARYQISWFNPRNGTWSDSWTLESNNSGMLNLTAFPGDTDTSTIDWGLKVKLVDAR